MSFVEKDSEAGSAQRSGCPPGDSNPHFSFGVAFREPDSPSAPDVLRWINRHITDRVIPDLLPYL